MTYYFSFLLIAAGAILRYAVSNDLWKNVNEDIVGTVLMVVGSIALLFSLIIVSMAGAMMRNAKSIAMKDTVPKPRRYQGRF